MNNTIEHYFYFFLKFQSQILYFVFQTKCIKKSIDGRCEYTVLKLQSSLVTLTQQVGSRSGKCSLE